MAHDREQIRPNRLLTATILNFVISIAEITGGIMSNSLALLSDALHNLSDAMATFIAWMAYKIGKRKSNEKNTFGYKRIEILAALLNAIVMVAISFYLFFEAYKRMIEPQEIKSLVMFIVASIGLVANVIAVIILHRDSAKNLNVKAAYLHLLGDTLSSVAVIIGSGLIYFFKIYWLDPVLTILIGLYILKETFSILKESVNILMQSTPAGIDLQKIKKDMESIEHVDNIHHVHTWNLDDQQAHFECHVNLKNNLNVSETASIQQQMEAVLHKNYRISHVTIQFEYNCCADDDLISSG